MKILFGFAAMASVLVSGGCGPESSNGSEASSGTLVADLSSIEIGQSGSIDGLWVHCGAEFLGTVAGRQWAAVDVDQNVIDWIPTGWEPFVDDQEEIALTVTLIERDLLEVSPSADLEPIRYRPTNEEAACE